MQGARKTSVRAAPGDRLTGQLPGGLNGRPHGTRNPLAVMLALAALFALMEWLFGPHRLDLALETGALNRGELWRLVAAHSVHLSPHHTMLNIAGLLLVSLTLWSVLRPGWLLGTIAASLAAISAGWWLLQPPDVTYVGFSGILHGIFAVGVLMYLREGPAWFGWIVLAGLCAKLGFEITQGPVPGANDAIAGRVSTLSHALGALGGALVGPWHAVVKPMLIALSLVALWAALRHEAALMSALARATA